MKKTPIFIFLLLFISITFVSAQETPQEIIDRLIEEGQTTDTTGQNTSSLDPERVTALEDSGFMYDADRDIWRPDPAEYVGNAVFQGQYSQGIPDDSLQAMSDAEFTVLQTEAGLAQDGFYPDTQASNEAGTTVWSNRVASEEVFGDTAPDMYTVDPVTGELIRYIPPITIDSDSTYDSSWVTTGDDDPFPGGASPLEEPGGGIVPCGNGENECTLCHLVSLAQNIIEALIFVAVLVAALLFLYAGVLYLMAPTSAANVAKGHSVFKSALIGLIVVLAAWLIINVFISYLFVGSDLADEIGVSSENWGEILCM